VNSKWFKDIDCISSIINQAFWIALSSFRSGGPDPQHCDTRFPRYPCFVLNLTCEKDGYDILPGHSDKSTVIFKSAADLKACIGSMLVNLFLKYHLEITESMKKFLISLGIVKTISASKDKVFGNRIEMRTPVQHDNAFDDAFFPSGSALSFKVDDNESDQIYLSDVNSSFSLQTQNNISRQNPAENNLTCNSVGSFSTPVRSKSDIYTSNDFNCSTKRRKVYNGDYGYGIPYFSPVKSSQLEYSPDNRTSPNTDKLDSDFSGGSLESKIKSPQSNFLTDLVISKHKLQDAQIIGQLDQKYILAVIGNSIVCIDQHAADERIRLEGYPILDEVDSCHVVEFPVSIHIPLSANEVYVLEHGGNSILLKWGFRFVLSSCRKAGQLLSSPKILGETLTEGDFLEFLSELECNTGLISNIKPPALKRIYASKACRGAVKFGDFLTHEHCQTILKKLGQTKFPFSW